MFGILNKRAIQGRLNFAFYVFQCILSRCLESVTASGSGYKTLEIASVNGVSDTNSDDWKKLILHRTNWSVHDSHPWLFYGLIDFMNLLISPWKRKQAVSHAVEKM